MAKGVFKQKRWSVEHPVVEHPSVATMEADEVIVCYILSNVAQTMVPWTHV